jgi:hypothetical protein
MEIPKEHKELLKLLGLDEEDFKRFDGKYVTYEYDPEKGVRLYDPYYDTSFKEYIGVDGWSAWSSEEDTFMSDIMEPVWEKTKKKDKSSSGPDQEEINKALRKKFSGKNGKDSKDS